MLPCGWLGGSLSGWLVGLLSDWAEIKFVIKNEYAQIIPAVKAVKTAKQNLSKAKDAYSAYQQDLAQQQAQLQDLQAKLEDDIVDVDIIGNQIGGN
jgi:ActR/RegA family two-component response regulator